MYACMHACMHACIHVCIMYVCVLYVYVCMCICMCVHVCMCVCACARTQIPLHYKTRTPRTLYNKTLDPRPEGSGVGNVLRVGRKEMFYLTTHSTHFILRLYGVGVLRVGHNTRDNGAKVMN